MFPRYEDDPYQILKVNDRTVMCLAGESIESSAYNVEPVTCVNWQTKMHIIYSRVVLAWLTRVACQQKKKEISVLISRLGLSGSFSGADAG
jgi:hypothetical protein